MTIELQADGLNQDGSVTIKLDGKDVKFVKESDLGAVKVQLKDSAEEVSKLQANLATANSKFDTEHQEVLKERTAKEQFEKGAGESATFKTKVGELETKVADLEKVGGELSTKFTARVRAVLVDGYKVDSEKIKDMALAELETTENALILTGAKPAPAVYDGKGGGGDGGGTEALKGKGPLALAAMGYEEKGKSKND